MKKQTNGDFRGAGRVSFLARKESIQKMLDEGYPLTAIYKQHKSDLNISYGQFTRYIQKYFRNEDHADDKTRATKGAPGKLVAAGDTNQKEKEVQDGSRNEKTGTKGKRNEERKSINLKDAFETENTDDFDEL